jgi:UDP-glucose 4-epimerase
MQKVFVVGGAGFIGSHLVDELALRARVTVYDDLSVGRREFVANAIAKGSVELVEGDVLDAAHLAAKMRGHDTVFHLAANPEARRGLANTRLDLEQGTIATQRVLEAMQQNEIRRVVLASSGTVYGDTRESCAEGDLGALPISLYGASKLASEALVSAFVECFAFQGYVFRFGNVVGPRGTHGAILDFLNKLKRTPSELEVLGDGEQSKPYVHVSDCVRGMLFGIEHARERLNVFNIAPADATSVARIAELCVQASPYPSARIRFTGGTRGWPGDVPVSRLNPAKLAALGFRVTHSSDQAVESAVRALATEVFST